MEITLIITATVLLISLVFNVVLLLRSKITKPQKQESYDVRMLLHDLTAHSGLVEIRRIDPSSVLLRSPREQ